MKELRIKAEIWSRVSGYFRPVDQWNNAKREEKSERRNLRFNLAPEEARQPELLNHRCE